MKLLGLDIGTTNSLLYEYSEETTKEICNIPSAVKVANGTIVEIGKEVWDDSKRDATWNIDQGFVKSPKLGIEDLQSRVCGVAYKEMIGAVLNKMLNKNIDAASHITMTIPNDFTEKNRNDAQELLTHCINTSFENQDIKTHFIPEPVAAALYYTHKHYHNIMEECLFIVCDIGAETTDISIVELKKEKHNLTFRIIEGGQHDSIGGNDFDLALENSLGNRLPADLTPNHRKNLINLIKCRLSILDQFNDFSVSISREEFTDSIKTQLNRLEELMRSSLKESKIEGSDKNCYIVPVGGSCRIPAIRKSLENVFKGAHQTYNEETNIFDCVAQGAAIYSAWCAKALRYNDYDNVNIVSQASRNEIHHDPSAIIDRYMACRNRLFSHASDDVDNNVLFYEMEDDVLFLTLVNKNKVSGHTKMDIKGSFDSISLTEISQNNEFIEFIDNISTKAILSLNNSISDKLDNIDVIVFSGKATSIQLVQNAVVDAIKQITKSDVIIPINIDTINI